MIAVGSITAYPAPKDGANGVAYYTWIRYANDSSGGGISNDPTGKTYIGFAYNKTTPTESNTPSDYIWSLIKGEKGDTGVQGAPGSNGQTYYTWIKYADNADGTGLYDVPNANTKYIGIAVNKTTATESSVKTDYTWSQFKGETGATGPQGVPGAPGSNGQTYYTWIKYADTSTGGGISNDPTNKTYIGFAYNKTTTTESNTASDYTWSLIKGEKGDTGVQGPTGANGQTFYTWIKYSDYADGTNLYDTPTSNTQYIGIAVNKTTPTESSVKTDYTWSKFKGETGATGEKGDTGDVGLTGLSIRNTEWVSGVYYRNDTSVTATERYLDYAIIVGSGDFQDGVGTNYSIYQAKAAHNGVISSTTNKPGSGANWATYWEKINVLKPVFTPILLASLIKASQIDVDSLIVKLLRTNSEGPRVEIAGSLIDVFGEFSSPNIRFGVNASGYAVLTYYDNNGNKLYDLGPQGINWGSIVQPSWSTTKLTPVSALQLGDVYPDWDDVATYHQGYVPVNNITTNTGNTYYKYYAGSNPTITQAQRDQEKYLHVTYSLTSDTIQDGWYSGSVNAPRQYIGKNTGRYIKPAADGIYPNANGVLDIDGTIKSRRLVEYKNGYATGRVVMVLWNDGEFV